jgi:hypothetical protein
MIEIEIDKLTNSIENAFTGERFITDVLTVNKKEIISTDWQFDWEKEVNKWSTQVYKLVTKGNESIIQGLLSVSDGKDHIFMNLIENAHFNKGQNKVYIGVAGNLIAYACKISFEKGYDGFVVFDSKTALIKHYEEHLFAKRLGGLRMYIDSSAALRLLNQYYNEK